MLCNFKVYRSLQMLHDRASKLRTCTTNDDHIIYKSTIRSYTLSEMLNWHPDSIPDPPLSVTIHQINKLKTYLVYLQHLVVCIPDTVHFWTNKSNTVHGRNCRSVFSFYPCRMAFGNWDISIHQFRFPTAFWLLVSL